MRQRCASSAIRQESTSQSFVKESNENGKINAAGSVGSHCKMLPDGGSD